MATVLSWNEKELEVTSNKQYTYGNWNAGVTYETETEDAGGGKQKKKKGGSGSPGIGTISFDVRLHEQLGIDVQAEYEWWRKQCREGVDSLLYLGTVQYGDCKWRLNSVTQSDLMTYTVTEKKENGGDEEKTVWKSCTMQISFEESAAKVQQTKLEKQAAKLSKKLEKAIKKAENAKTDKAREKAAKSAAKLQKQLEAVQVKVAEEKAAAAKAKREAKQQAAEMIKRYYDQ